MSRHHSIIGANPRASLIKAIEHLSYRKRTWEVWTDFCELSALAFANAVDLTPKREPREARYHQIRARYEPEEFARFPFAISCLVQAHEEAGFDDVLGGVFMELDLGSHWHGQFFTPYPLASMMARLTFDETDPLNCGEWHAFEEPAAGAGGMIIALAQAMRLAGHNPQTQLYVTARDIDALCVHMTYVQMVLHHIPGMVIHCNTLSLEEWAIWYTPAHIMGSWSYKLRRRRRELEAAELLSEEPHGAVIETVCIDAPCTDIDTTSNKVGQLALF